MKIWRLKSEEIKEVLVLGNKGISSHIIWKHCLGFPPFWPWSASNLKKWKTRRLQIWMSSISCQNFSTIQRLDQKLCQFYQKWSRADNLPVITTGSHWLRESWLPVVDSDLPVVVAQNAQNDYFQAPLVRGSHLHFSHLPPNISLHISMPPLHIWRTLEAIALMRMGEKGAARGLSP